MAPGPALTLTAPAKLNLFLHVTGRRADGYHLLQTLFQLVDLCDRVTLQTAPAGVLELLPGADAPGGDDDLTLRAARLLRDATGVAMGARIGLHKRIPAGGGLGGGSSDAAAVLLGLDRLWGLDLGGEALEALGARLGADVPVFVRGRTAWAEGVGERLTPIHVEPAHYLILHPRVHVATAQIFADPELTRDSPVSRIPAVFGQGGRNDCEPVVRRLHPEVDRALDWLSTHGDARLTGTGACVFLACDDEARARQIAAQCPPEFAAFTVRSLDVSPVLEQLGAYAPGARGARPSSV
ncbi:MAG TPA: 4-(cytidine 5'-diphospho)-2-C-methyl-D-erythritol kinase [Pseudomonadales bacterium]|nr:4-(cytidine 5'-diphospho)-2-C-methyl-D-erythritol kinase [Pseudomonadales bacterium]